MMPEMAPCTGQDLKTLLIRLKSASREALRLGEIESDTHSLLLKSQ